MKTGSWNYTYSQGSSSVYIMPGCMVQQNRQWMISYKGWKKHVVTGILTFSLLLSFDDFSMESNRATLYLNPAPVKQPLNSENLVKEIEKNGILCPAVVMAQFKLESGNFNSFLFRHTNNMMGMRYPFKRKTTARGIYIPAKDTIIYGSKQDLRKYSKYSSYAVYDSWQDAVADYKLWQEASFITTERYLGFLGKVYAEDSLYIAKLRKMARVNQASVLN